jgi:hypothetical protein
VEALFRHGRLINKDRNTGLLLWAGLYEFGSGKVKIFLTFYNGNEK